MPSARALRSNLRSLRFLRFPLRSLSRDGGTVGASLADAVPGTTAEGVRAGGKQLLLRRDGSLCHTCSLRQPAARVLHSAALRCGRDSE